jgi:sugar/nucleoside kinase (ribokinase family)
MAKVLVVGDVMVDVVVKPEGPIAVGADTRAAIRMLPGGSGANQACWLAREGVATTFVGRVGAADRSRQKLLLAEHGVDARLAADESLPTGTLITLLSDHDRSFLTDRAANLNLSMDDLPATLLDGVDLLHVSGYSLFDPKPRAAVLALLAEAARRTIPISVDPASYSFLEEVGAENFMEWTRGARFLFPNEDEAASLTGSRDPQAQLDFLTRHHPIVAIKRGAAGAVAGDEEGGRWSAPAPPAEPVDTSGAGDAFLGGFLSAYLRGEGIAAALKRGVELGSEAVTTMGARP